jgi:6-pyruvoyltetrahydropterin/6-carboxytetrahydropterin synthase
MPKDLTPTLQAGGLSLIADPTSTIEELLDRVVDHYRSRLLNELAEFEGLNPSIEHLSRRFFDRLSAGLGHHRFVSIEVRIWETAEAWAAYRERFR